MKAWSRRRRRMSRRCSACSCYMSTTHEKWKREKRKLMYRLRCMIRDSEFKIRDLRFENMTMKPWNMENENSAHETWKVETWNWKHGKRDRCMDKQLFDEYKPRAAVDFEGCDLKADLLNTFVFSGSAAEGAALLSPPTPTPEGSGVWGNRLLIVSYW